MGRRRSLALASLVLSACGTSEPPAAPSDPDPPGAWQGARLLADAGMVPLSDCGVRYPPCRTYGDDRYHPTLAVNARGDGIVLWQQEERGYRQWWSPISAASGFGSPRPTGQDAGSYQPRVSVDAHGHGVGVWEWYVPPFDVVTTGPPERAAMSRLAPGGGWTAPRELGAEQDRWLDLDLDAGGAAVVAYQQGCGRYFVPGCPDGKALDSARFRADGGPVVRERIRADDRFPCAKIDNQAQVVATPTGALALWTEYGSRSVFGCAENFMELWSSRHGPGGWSPPQPLERNAWLGGFDDLDIAADAQGEGFVIDVNGPRYDEMSVRVRPFTAEGFAAPIVLAPRGRGARIAMSRGGRALAWWIDSEEAPTGGRVNRLRARWYDEARRAWSDTYALPPEAGVMFDQARAAVDERGHAMVAWAAVGRNGDPGEIRASRFAPGRGFGPIAGLRAPGPPSEYVSPPAMGADARGNTVVAWSESDGVRVAIWTNSYAVP
jgi:hypothetical protein